MAEKMTIIDRGWIELIRNLQKADNSHTKVGLNQGAKGKDLSDLVLVGAVNEFGTKGKTVTSSRSGGSVTTGGIPERPFMRSTFDEQFPNINAMVANEYDKILQSRSTVKISLGRIGAFVKGRIQAKITALTSPPNAPSTRRQKKSSNPLIDTGEMRQAISHVEVIVG